MTQCKTAVSPVQTHWRYCSLALSHRYIVQSMPYLIYSKIYSSVGYNADDIGEVSSEQCLGAILLVDLDTTVQDALVLARLGHSQTGLDHLDNQNEENILQIYCGQNSRQKWPFIWHLAVNKRAPVVCWVTVVPCAVFTCWNYHFVHLFSCARVSDLWPLVVKASGPRITFQLQYWSYNL